MTEAEKEDNKTEEANAGRMRVERHVVRGETTGTSRCILDVVVGANWSLWEASKQDDLADQSRIKETSLIYNQPAVELLDHVEIGDG